MDMIEILQQRTSIRKYKDSPVDFNMILQLLDAARLAPSAMNQQTWEFIWIDDPAVKEQLYNVCVSQVRGKMEFLKESAGIIAAVCRPEDSPRWARINVAIALQNIAITAVSLGLGTCWVGAFDPKIVGPILKVPEDREVVAMMVVGWPDQVPTEKDRKPLEDICYKNQYGKFLLK
ncbi:MAG: nitroreductase family protein [Candidatus Ranarchaeia archaeon]